MTRALIPATPAQLPARPSPELASRARRYVEAGKAANTKRAYGTAWSQFESFCESRSRPYPSMPAPAVAVIDYVTHLADAGRKASTIQVALAAITFMHVGAHQVDPTATPEVRATMAGIRRTIGTRQTGKAPMLFDDLRRVVDAIGRQDLRDLRDRAVILLGYAGAFRRSELVAVSVDHIKVGQFMTVTLPRSKTDQEGAGLSKAIPALADESMCPVRAVRDWLNAAGIRSGVVFRSIDRWGHMHGQMDGREIARILQRRAEAAGLDSRQFAGHSLRAGFVTQAAIAGAQVWEIKEITGHKSDAIVGRYVRAAGQGGRRAVRAAFAEGSPGSPTSSG